MGHVKLLISQWLSNFRRSHLQMFVIIDVLKNFAIFTGKHLYWSLILIKLQAFRPVTLLKSDSNAGVTVNNYSPKKITPGVIITQEKSTPGVIFSWEKFTPTWKKVLP